METAGVPTRPGGPDPLEADLLKKARAGNLFAFEEIVKRYQKRVYGVARRIVGRHDVADDVTQEAFLKAYQALASFDVARPFGPWICRIAANLAVNFVRSPRARERELLEQPPAPEKARAQDPLGQVLEGEAQQVFARALATLPPEQRAVLVLRAVEELSYREIADALQISMGTVMSRLARAREKLRLALLPYLGQAASRAGGST